MLIELFCFSTVFISLLVGCKKKNDASKLKPRNMDKTAGAGTPTAGGTPAIRKSEAEAAKKDEPVEKAEEKMVERPADDNETINDAKSNWGAVS